MPAFKPLRNINPDDLALGNAILDEIWQSLQPPIPKPTLIFAKQHASASAWLNKNAISIRYDSYKKWNTHIKRSVMLHEVLHLLGMHHLGFALDDLAHILRPQIWGIGAENEYKSTLMEKLEKRLGHRVSLAKSTPYQEFQASTIPHLADEKWELLFREPKGIESSKFLNMLTRKTDRG